ncbi:MAG: hypothetical protein IV091_16590 [Polaromonas sp.]|nr:hypothetical protein [Polaromonas sp.]
MIKPLKWLSGLGACAFFVGCAGPAPNYSPSIDNVELLKKSSIDTLKVGQIGVTPEMPGASAINLRASSMVSPVGAHYGDYLAAALRQELELAKLQDPQSKVEVSGVLTKNNIDAGGISTNEGQIEARFMVKRSNQVTYDKVKKTEMKWESSFAGAVAIPRAANNYPLMVQNLLSSLFIDPDFIRAVKK